MIIQMQTQQTKRQPKHGATKCASWGYNQLEFPGKGGGLGG